MATPMFLPAAVASLVVLATPASDDLALRAKVMRRLELQQALKQASSPACRGLAALSLAVPPTAVLSQLEFNRKGGRWDFALSQGTKADSQTLVDALLNLGLCSAASPTAHGASCLANETVVPLTLAAADEPHVMKKREAAGLLERLEQSRTSLPDAPELESIAASELATANAVTGFVWKTGPSIAGVGVDRFELSASGTSSFVGAAGFICDLTHLRRLISVDALTLGQPRVRNGEWVVDFSVKASTWRYRSEDEMTAVSLKLSTPAAVKGADDGFDFIRTRSPFGPPVPRFAGSARRPTGTECTTEASVTPLGEAELDSYSVIFLSAHSTSPCAMVVDAEGRCHELRPNTAVGRLKVTKIDEKGITLGEFRHFADGDGKPVFHSVTLKAETTRTQPAWFCRAP